MYTNNAILTESCTSMTLSKGSCVPVQNSQRFYWAAILMSFWRIFSNNIVSQRALTNLNKAREHPY